MVVVILLMSGISLLLYLTGVFVIFTPLPFVYGFLRKGFLPFLGSFLIGLVSLFLLYHRPVQPLGFLPFMVFYPHLDIQALTKISLVYFSFYGVVAGAISIMARKGGSIEKSMLQMVLMIIVIMTVVTLGVTNGHPSLLISGTKNALNNLIQNIISLQEASPTVGDEVLYFKQYSNVIVSTIVGLLPALLINFILLTLGLNVMLVRKWMTQEKFFSQWVDFALWRLNEKWIWVPIGIGSLFFLNLYLILSSPLALVLTNALLIVGLVYFFQGLAVVSFLFRRKLSPFSRLFGYLLVLLFIQLVGLLVIFVGLFDFWFDFRKLKKVA